MGSPLGPTLANAFFVHFVTKFVTKLSIWLWALLLLAVYWWYICFIYLTTTLRSLPKFSKWSTCYQVIYDWEWKAKQSWCADIREDETFTTSAYHKPTFSGVYRHFDSFLPSTCKFGTVYTLPYRCLRICSSWTKLHN